MVHVITVYNSQLPHTTSLQTSQEWFFMEGIMTNILSMRFIYEPMGAILEKVFSSLSFASCVAQALESLRLLVVL